MRSGRELRFCRVRRICRNQADAVPFVGAVPRLSSMVRMAFFASVGVAVLDWKVLIALVS